MKRIINVKNMENMGMVAPIGADRAMRAMYEICMAHMSVTPVQSHKSTISITNDMPESGGGASTGVTDGPDVAASDDDDGGDSEGEPARRSPLKNPSPSGKHRTVTATAGALSDLPQNPDIALWRLPTVLAHIPVSRSGWWQGVKTGRYPAPVKLSTRCVAWRSADIRTLIASF